MTITYIVIPRLSVRTHGQLAPLSVNTQTYEPKQIDGQFGVCRLALCRTPGRYDSPVPVADASP